MTENVRSEDASESEPRGIAPGARLAPGEWRITLLLGATFAVAAYDASLLGLALPQIQAGLGIAEADIGRDLAVVRLGIVPALGLAMLADRVGRRRMLVLTLLGFATCHATSALARSPGEFVALQLAARSFALAEEMVAIVALTEHLSARSRGFGLGVLAALEDVGHGHAAVSFGLLGNVENGWRWLYAAGAAPLLLVAWLQRSLLETPRFEAERRRRMALGARPHRRSFAAALRRYPGRLAAMVAVAGPLGYAGAAALAFASKTLQEEHGYTPGEIAKLFAGLGLLLLPASLLLGAMADRLGRRRILIGALLVHALGASLFYVSTHGVTVVAGWLVMMLGWAGCEVVVSVVGAELFPTSCRVTASGLSAIALAGGAALGLWSESVLVGVTGEHATAIVYLLPALGIAVLAVLAMPETAAQELEIIAPDVHP